MPKMSSRSAAKPPQNLYESTRAEYNAPTKTASNAYVSKRSEYEEIEEIKLIEECTLYAIYLQPHAPIADSRATKTICGCLLSII